MDVVARVTGHRHRPGLCRMVDLAVAAASALDRPTIILQNLQQLANLHSILRPYHGRDGPLPQSKRHRSTSVLSTYHIRKRSAGWSGQPLVPAYSKQWLAQAVPTSLSPRASTTRARLSLMPY